MGVFLWVGLLAASPWVAAQGPAAPGSAAKAPAEQGIRWNDLKPPQKSALLPLERQWSEIDPIQKRKWLELSARFPHMSPTERARIQDRMTEWARLTPSERGAARLRFQEAKDMTPADRQARWDAYQALSPEQKRQFAARAATVEPVKKETGRNGSTQHGRIDRGPREPAQSKSNIVPNPELAAAPRTVTPTVVQVRPGATTTPITRRAAPPWHEQPGVPKIAATPEFVNRATLLPRRGPQAAATQPVTVPGSQPAASR